MTEQVAGRCKVGVNIANLMRLKFKGELKLGGEKGAMKTKLIALFKYKTLTIDVRDVLTHYAVAYILTKTFKY